MEKGKLQRSAKDASKRSRQVSDEGLWGAKCPGRGVAIPSLTFWGGRRGCGLKPPEWGYRGADAAPSPQAPVLYAMLDHSRSTKAASEKKAKGAPGDSRKDKK